MSNTVPASNQRWRSVALAIALSGVAAASLGLPSGVSAEPAAPEKLLVDGVRRPIEALGRRGGKLYVAVTHESQAKRELRAFSSRRKFRSFLVNDQNLRLARRSLRPARPEVARAASGDVTIGPFQGAVFWEHAGMSGNSLWKRSGSGQVRSLRGECMVRDFWGFCRSSWNDKISSLQTTTSAALVCEHDNFQGVCAYVAPHLNASWITTPNMPFGFWNDRISSLCMY